MDKRVTRIIKGRGLEKVLRLPYANANMINEPAREVRINERAEISYKADSRSEMVYVIGFDSRTNRLVFSSGKNERNCAFTTDVHAIQITYLMKYKQLKLI